MKRFFTFLVLAVLFTGCDDGDMEEVSFEFNESDALPCNDDTDNFFIYKTTDQRALILKLAEGNFTNTVTSDSLELGVIDLPINDDNQLIYRVYNDEITQSTMCPDSGIPATYPVVTEERSAQGGRMLIRTTPVKSEEQADGSTEITDYLHTISFVDITFVTADGTQRNESLPAVTYRTDASEFNFDTLDDVKTCAENNYTLLFRYVNDQGMTLRLSEADAAFLFSTDFSAPKVRFLNSENILTYRFFARADITPLTEDYFCSVTQPDLPSVKYIWTGNSSVSENTGVIEVVTEQVDDQEYIHTITLKNVTMARGSQNFKLERDFIFGEVETITAP